MLHDRSQETSRATGRFDAPATAAGWVAPFEADAGLDALTLQIDGALHLQDQLAAEKIANAALGAALDQSCHGIVIATAEGGVVFANVAARLLAKRGGLVLSETRVSCADQREAARLAALIDCAAQGGPGGCTRISQGPKRAILAATASPLPLDGDAAGQPLALLTLRDLGATSDAGEANLMELFGLTGAEAAIVPQLLAGDSMSLIAQSRGVSAATVRAQATRLLEKTGATNLRALASMIAALGCG